MTDKTKLQLCAVLMFIVAIAGFWLIAEEERQMCEERMEAVR